MPLHFISVQAM